MCVRYQPDVIRADLSGCKLQMTGHGTRKISIPHEFQFHGITTAFRRKCKIPDHSGITHHIIICQFPDQPDIRHIRKHDFPALYRDRLRRNVLQNAFRPAVIFQRHFDPV